MSDIASAKLAINQQRYEESFEILSQFDFANLSEQEQLEYWNSFLLVLRKMDSLDSYWKTYKSYRNLIPVKIRFKILKEISKDDLSWKKAFFLKGWWEALIELGNIDEAKKVSISYIEHLLLRKNFKEALSFISGLSEIYRPNEDIDLYKIQFLLQQENYKEINEELKEKREYLAPKLFKHFYNRDSDAWKKSQYLFEIILEEFYIKLEENEFQIPELRSFVNLLYEYLVFFPNESFGVLYLLKYALISKKKNYVYKVKEVALNQTKRFCTNYDYEKDILAIVKALDSMNLIDSVDQTICSNEFDFATDLIHGKTIRENMIKRLERDIKFLSRAGMSEQLEEFKLKLKALDKDNTLFFTNETKSTEKKSLPYVEMEIDSIPILYELYPKLSDVERSSFQKSIRSIPENSIIENHNDYFAMIYMMADPDLIKFYLSLLEDLTKNVDIYNEILYYKILYYKMNHEFERALATVEQILTSAGLEYEFELEVKYQRGEICFENRMWNKALEYFSNVSAVDPNYRMTRYRLWILNEK